MSVIHEKKIISEKICKKLNKINLQSKLFTYESKISENIEKTHSFNFPDKLFNTIKKEELSKKLEAILHSLKISKFIRVFEFKQFLDTHLIHQQIFHLSILILFNNILINQKENFKRFKKFLNSSVNYENDLKNLNLENFPKENDSKNFSNIITSVIEILKEKFENNHHLKDKFKMLNDLIYQNESKFQLEDYRINKNNFNKFVRKCFESICLCFNFKALVISVDKIAMKEFKLKSLRINIKENKEVAFPLLYLLENNEIFFYLFEKERELQFKNNYENKGEKKRNYHFKNKSLNFGDLKIHNNSDIELLVRSNQSKMERKSIFNFNSNLKNKFDSMLDKKKNSESVQKTNLLLDLNNICSKNTKNMINQFMNMKRTTDSNKQIIQGTKEINVLTPDSDFSQLFFSRENDRKPELNEAPKKKIRIKKASFFIKNDLFNNLTELLNKHENNSIGLGRVKEKNLFNIAPGSNLLTKKIHSHKEEIIFDRINQQNIETQLKKFSPISKEDYSPEKNNSEIKRKNYFNNQQKDLNLNNKNESSDQKPHKFIPHDILYQKSTKTNLEKLHKNTYSPCLFQKHHYIEINNHFIKKEENQFNNIYSKIPENQINGNIPKPGFLLSSPELIKPDVFQSNYSNLECYFKKQIRYEARVEMNNFSYLPSIHSRNYSRNPNLLSFNK